MRRLRKRAGFTIATVILRQTSQSQTKLLGLFPLIIGEILMFGVEALVRWRIEGRRKQLGKLFEEDIGLSKLFAGLLRRISTSGHASWICLL